MRFTPQTEEELEHEMLIPAGEYDFTVADAVEKTSKSGNPMIELNLIVFVDGHQQYVRDWLLTSLVMQKYKVRHFCASTGLLEKYDTGELNARDCISRSGQLKLGIQEGKGNYGPQNSVKDYIADSVQSQGDTLNPKPVLNVPDEEYPF